MKNTLRDLTPPILWRFLRRIVQMKLKNQISTSSYEVARVLEFFTTFQDFRTKERCSVELGYDLSVVELIRSHLYKQGQLGAYSLGLVGPPHDLMRDLVCNRFSIDSNTLILEIGPGASPLFPKELFPNSYSIDKYGTKGQLLLYGNVKLRESTADFLGGYSTIDEIDAISKIVEDSGGFDLVAGCHSFEHETKPLKALRNIQTVLKTLISL